MLISTSHFNEEASSQYNLLDERDQENFLNGCGDREMTKHQMKRRILKIFSNVQNEVSVCNIAENGLLVEELGKSNTITIIIPDIYIMLLQYALGRLQN